MADVLMQAVSDPESVGGDGALYTWVSDGFDFPAEDFPGPGDPIYVAGTPRVVGDASGGAGSGGAIVAKAGGINTDGADSADTPVTLYTVPTGKAGMYRMSGFVGPATPAGNGQVNLLARGFIYPPNSGNLEFARVDSFGLGTMTIGEGSSTGAGQSLVWWAAEGAAIKYELQSSFDGGDWAWGVTLEYLGPS